MAIDATRTDIKVCSNSLSHIGENEISDFTSDGNQPRGGTCGRLYPTFKKSVLARHPWKFALKKLQLSLDLVAPINQWTNQFLFPGDRLANSPYRIYDSVSVGAFTFRKFEIFGERVMTDASTLWMDYVHDAVESLWPENFVEFIEIAFAARLAIPIAGKRALRADLMTEAYGPLTSSGRNGGLYQRVKTSNAIGSPVTFYGDDTLAEARFGGLSKVPTGGENFIF